MKSIGLAPYLTTVWLCLRAYSWNRSFSCGCTGHWLQSFISTASKGLSNLLNTTLLSAVKEYDAMPVPDLKCDSMSCQLSPAPLIVTDVERYCGRSCGSPAATRRSTMLCMLSLK